MEPLRIAVIGAGLIGRRHVEIASDDPGCTVAAIADPSVEAATYAQARRIAHFADYVALLDVVKPDAAIIAAPNVLHVPIGLACAERGVHMLVEKPIADTVEAAQQLTHAAERAGVVLLVGHHRRHNPIIERARDIVQDGVIGRVTAISGQWMLLKPDDYFGAAHRRETGAGPILTNLIHDVDDLRFICGEIESVQAMASNAVRGFAVEDTVVALFRFASGALGTIAVSDVAASPWSWELTAGENPFYPQQRENCYLIAGTEGALAVPKLELWRYRSAGDRNRGWGAPLAREQMHVEHADPLLRQLRHFCAAIRGEELPRITGSDATRTLAVIRAVLAAAHTGASVGVNAVTPV